MFVVLVGSIITFIEAIAHPRHLHVVDHGLAVPDRALRQLRRGHGRGPRQGPGRHPAKDALGDRSPAACVPDGTEELVAAARSPRATSWSARPNDVIPSDGEIIEGIASVDESAITGESAPVIRESGGDRSAVTGGTKVLSDRIVVRITAERGQTFLDRMITLVEGANRQKTPNEIALTILLAVLTIVFIPVVVTLRAVRQLRRRARSRS